MQGQPRYTWPPSFALARAYLDQLQRDQGLDHARIRAARESLATAEAEGGDDRSETLRELAVELREQAGDAADADKVRTLAEAVARLAAAGS
ncbi:MAG: hypothetical protein GWM90_22115 [Gemmatimonadetes bacterium]|nr:hypothetical protein [Gemmatimonadota bacterium]NIQ57282.1 hypothetical protein [Gemmatimonadota bacterium]NIU77447.1 hypothetical protein [Gammaproteobacteria bacterium]NIX46679.1 hypothetical protein [Gemmatimonadota bacterium]NIY11022.1 hypothetical protein [Gemmatimonadota bacterium]